MHDPAQPVTWTPYDAHRLAEVLNFARRPWYGRKCSLDDIVVYAAKTGANPIPLMRLALLIGEWEEPRLLNWAKRLLR